MAEYWKSAPRFWCKQCKIYIRDTPFEKTQHEASPKHQGNLKRFLRDIHRDNERQTRETQRAKSEVERLKQVVAGGKDGSGSSGNVPPWKKDPVATQQTGRAPTAEDRKKQISQLAEMGVAIPDEYRGELALAGEWQTVSERAVASENELGPSGAVGVRKRKHEGDGSDEEDIMQKATSKGWGARTRQYPGEQDEDDDDLDTLLASTKDIGKAKMPESEPVKEEKPATPFSFVTRTEKDITAAANTDATQPPIKTEENPIENPAPKEDPDEVPPGVVFKKRKPKAMRK